MKPGDKKPMTASARARKKRFAEGDVFRSLGEKFICHGNYRAMTNLGYRVTKYVLEAPCEDCRWSFRQNSTRAEIRGDRLRRRCDECKAPGKITRAVAAGAAERRRKKAAEAEKVRRDELHMSRLVELAEATGSSLPASMSLSDLFRAEQMHIRRTRLIHQRSAKMLGVPLSEIVKIEVERRARLVMERS